MHPISYLFSCCSYCISELKKYSVAVIKLTGSILRSFIRILQRVFRSLQNCHKPIHLESKNPRGMVKNATLTFGIRMPYQKVDSFDHLFSLFNEETTGNKLFNDPKKKKSLLEASRIDEADLMEISLPSGRFYFKLDIERAIGDLSKKHKTPSTPQELIDLLKNQKLVKLTDSSPLFHLALSQFVEKNFTSFKTIFKNKKE